MIRELWSHRKGRLLVSVVMAWMICAGALVVIAFLGERLWSLVGLVLLCAGGLVAILGALVSMVARLKLAIDYRRHLVQGEIAALREADERAIAADSRQAKVLTEMNERISNLQVTLGSVQKQARSWSEHWERKCHGLERSLLETGRRVASVEESSRFLESLAAGLLATQGKREIEGLESLSRDVSRLERRLWSYRRRQVDLEDQLSIPPVNNSSHLSEQLEEAEALMPGSDLSTEALLEEVRKYSEETRREVAGVRRQLTDERSRRIVAAAQVEAEGRRPQQLILIVCPNRTGSTWILDALRSHPLVDLEPTARIHRALSLVSRANRYPVGLVSDGNSHSPIELRPGYGEMVPSFTLEQYDGDPRIGANFGEEGYSIEKIHPEFFRWDSHELVRRVDQIERGWGQEVRFLYRQRDPRLSIRSMIQYKRRDRGWYRSLAEEEVPAFFARTWNTMAELSEARPGLVVSFEEQMGDGVGALTRVFQWLWPAADSGLQREIASAADLLTSVASRRPRIRAPFWGDSLIETSEQDDILGFLESHRDAVESCYASYERVSRSGVLTERSSSRLGRRAAGGAGIDRAR